jgi:hypothetical protein
MRPPTRRRRGGATLPSGVMPPETVPVGDIETIIDQETTEDRPWLVIVWNDPINLMSFVTFVLQKLFGYSKEKATALMLGLLGHPGAGRARRLPAPRARPVGDHGAVRVTRTHRPAGSS